MFKLDLRKFKKVSGDKHHTIMRHEAGHEIKLDHKSLAPQLLKQLHGLEMIKDSGEKKQSNPKLEESKKMPPKQHLAEGGNVEEDMPAMEAEMPSPDVAEAPMTQPTSQAQPEPISLAGTAGDALRTAAGLQAAPAAAMMPSTPGMPAKAPSVADELSQASATGALEQQVKGIKAQASAEAQLGEGLAKQALERHKQFQSLEERAQKVNDLIDGELKSFIDDRRNDRIQPNQYMANMSTGQKILTGIALGLGGLGQGLAGGANPALEYLNKEIDRDIDAQVKNMNIKESLVTANLKRFGNMQDAIAMSKALMLADAANMADMLKNKSSSQVSKARADQLIGQLKAQIAPQLETLKTKAMLQDMAYGHPMAQGKPTEHGGLIPMDPTSLVPKMVPEKAQKEVFAEVKRAMDTRHISETALKNFDELSQGYQGLGRVTGAVYDPAQKGVLRDVIAQTVGDKTGSVRELAFQEAMHAYMPVPTDTAERAAQKRENFVAYLTSKQSAPTFKAYTGVDIDRFGPTATAESAQAAGKPMGQPQLVEREETASGRKALFDPATKQFVRWK